MAIHGLIETLETHGARLASLDERRDYEAYTKTVQEVRDILSKLMVMTLDSENAEVLEPLLLELLPHYPFLYRDALCQLLWRIGATGPDFQNFVALTLRSIGDHTSPYHVPDLACVHLLRAVAGSPGAIPALLDNVESVLESDAAIETRLWAAYALSSTGEGSRAGPLLEGLSETQTFRHAVVELMLSQKDTKRYVASDGDELRRVFEALSAISPRFAAIVHRYRGRIHGGAVCLKCPACGDYGVFLGGEHTAPALHELAVESESCGAGLVLSRVNVEQAPGHEEHEYDRYFLRIARTSES